MSELRVSSFDFERNGQCGTGDHHPHNVYCPEPEWCCQTWDRIALLCCVDGEPWPCATKREHVEERHAGG